MRRSSAIVFFACASTATIAAAQDRPSERPHAPAPSEENEEAGDIVVQGVKPPGSVVGDIPPEQTLSPADIRSYGVSSVADLLTELSPQTRSDRGSGGAPVVLLNGKRISSLAEIRDIPTEAILRAEILPEEVALKYGYRADQRVVNIVLRRRFRALTTELADTVPTAGGNNSPGVEADLLKIQSGTRANVHLSYKSSTALTEDERGILPIASPFAVGGNITGVGGGAIDPALGTATIVGVPRTAGATTPSLGDFAGTAANVADPGAYRTLVPSSRDFAVNTNYATSILGTVSASFNGRLEVTDSHALNGPANVALTLPAGNPFSPFSQAVVVDRALGTGYLPLRQDSSSVIAHLGTTLNGNVGSWQWSVTGTYDRTESETFTDVGVDASAFQARLNAGDRTANPYGPLSGQLGVLPVNRGYSTAQTGGADALFSGTLFKLPAGAISTSIRIGAQANSFDSHSFRSNIEQAGTVRRDIVNGQINVDVPLTSRSKQVLGAIGTLSANFNLAVDHLSDFGTLTTVGYGVNWAPIPALRIIASATDQDDAPTAQQLGNPSIITPNVRVFDYVRGTTAIVTAISGGNRGLLADTTHTKKIGATLKPWAAKDINLTANYVQVRTENSAVSFPGATAAIESVFPSRFVRDADGDLTQIDQRPINFAESRRSELRWGVNFSVPLKSKIQKAFEAYRAGKGPNPLQGLLPPGGRRGDGAPPGGPNGGGPRNGGFGGPGGGPGGPGGGGGGPRGGGFRGGGGGFGGRGQGGGRLQFAVYHTWHFTDRVLVAQGGPALDLLRGDTVGSGGGQPRHEIEAQAGYSNNGLGARLSADWQSATDVTGGTVGNPDPLHFSALGTINLRLFADLGQRLDLVKAHPWVRGMRIAVGITNLFDTRQTVRDAQGVTPVSYQPGYINPLGRTIRVSVRKLLF
ncbi:TonB-dependent receptor [Sphingomonas sp. H39-1-10]|uniref:TonB-dependent receptor n=1 Tax=Sphingomonas pollutisoli TaxID=3030829 RepID=UPI0023B923D9|nr:TonB-dependent receptor [Sphingomonas pollutisoli]MDF0488945.1 TonB-dependent receptor [Sphingomonas pollutisoli]